MGIRNFFNKLRGVTPTTSEPSTAVTSAEPNVQGSTSSSVTTSTATMPPEKQVPQSSPPPVTAVAPVQRVPVQITPILANPAPKWSAKDSTKDPVRNVAAPIAPPRPQMPIKPVSPLALTGGPKNQSDWMLLQIGKMGRAFLALAEKNQLLAPTQTPVNGTFVRHDMTAALLAYRLVVTAYHLHQDAPSLEALRIVRTAMTGMLHRAVDITVEQTGKKEERTQMLAAAEDQFRFAESEVQDACARRKTRTDQIPFAAFYPGLSPAFGSPESSAAAHRRFGPLLEELFAKIEAAMAARNHQITG